MATEKMNMSEIHNAGAREQQLSRRFCAMTYASATFRYVVVGIFALLLVLLIFALESCTVGPKYVRPSVPTPKTYKEQAPASSQGTPDQWRPANSALQ